MSSAKERQILKTECSICKSNGKTRFCSRCETISYCSQECQRIDWPSHKSICLVLKVQVDHRRNLMKLIDTHMYKIILGLALLRKFRPKFFKVSSDGEYLVPNILVNNHGIRFDTSVNVQHLIIEKDTISVNLSLTDDDGKYVFVESDSMKASVSVHQNLPLNDIKRFFKNFNHQNFNFTKFNHDFFN